MSPEEQLIKAVGLGDPKAFKALVDTYKDMVYTLCLRMVKNTMIAEELTQDAFLKAYRSIHSYRHESKFSTWLYRIAYNTCISSFRKQKVEEVELTDFNQESTVNRGLINLEEGDRNEMLKKLILNLKEEDQVIIQLFYLQELSIKEISEVTGLSDSNVKVKLHRSKQKLKVFIESGYSELWRDSA